MTDCPTYVTIAVQVVVDASVTLPDLFVIRSRAAGRRKETESCRKDIGNSVDLCARKGRQGHRSDAPGKSSFPEHACSDQNTAIN